MSELKPCAKKPCKECPFRKTSSAGYLGDASYDPELFLSQGEKLPCHLSVDYSGSKSDYSKAKFCTGNLQFLNNGFKLSRDSEIREQQERAGKNDDVFKFREEFIRHHDDKTRARKFRAGVVKHLRLMQS